MIFCTFAGHREVFGNDIEKQVGAVIENMLRTDRKFVFYSGDMGQFDKECAAAVRSAKRTHPELDISLIAVLPYITNFLNTNKSYYENYFDDIIIPTELTGVYYKKAILCRNQWLVDHSNLLIAYVYRNFGGAYTTLKYAARKNKKIISIADIYK